MFKWTLDTNGPEKETTARRKHPAVRGLIKERSFGAMTYLRYRRFIALAALLCFLAAASFAQDEGPAMDHSVTVRPKPTGVTPRTPDGHPDFTGVWNGMADNLLGVPNQIHNEGVEVENDHSTYDVLTGVKIATWPQVKGTRQDSEQGERAATLLRRMGSSRPLYKPEYWEMVKSLDANANEEDPSNNCMPAGVPRVGSPSYIAQFPTHLMFVYPGQGGLIATQTSYRMVPLDGRKHTPLRDLDGSYNGEAIAYWDGDTLVIDTYGFNTSTWIDQLGGYFHSENMHVIERLRRDGNTLTWTATIDDPDVLLEPWTTTPRIQILNPNPHAMLPESLPCSERDLAHAVTKEHH
jgi:hypothetical protein